MYKQCTSGKKNVTILILFFAIQFIHFNSRAQQAPLLDKTVTLQLTGVSVGDVLTALTEQTGARFSYSSTQLDVQRKTTVNFNRKPLKEALNELLGKQLKGLRVNGQQITIQTSSGRGSIGGSVKTKDGKAAEFVTVSIKGLKSAQVDARGNYILKDLEEGTYTLIASFVGLITRQKEVNVTSGELVPADFILSENNEQLQEVVVNGGRTNKFSVKKSTTSAKMPLGNLENPQVYTTIPKTLLTEQIVTDFTSALKNSPGVYKIQGSRGINSDGATFYSMRGFRTEAALMDGVPA